MPDKPQAAHTPDSRPFEWTYGRNDTEGALDHRDCPRFPRRCGCGKCSVCGHLKHTALHCGINGGPAGSKPFGHKFIPIEEGQASEYKRAPYLFEAALDLLKALQMVQEEIAGSLRTEECFEREQREQIRAAIEKALGERPQSGLDETADVSPTQSGATGETDA